MQHMFHGIIAQTLVETSSGIFVVFWNPWWNWAGTEKHCRDLVHSDAPSKRPELMVGAFSLLHRHPSKKLCLRSMCGSPGDKRYQSLPQWNWTAFFVMSLLIITKKPCPTSEINLDDRRVVNTTVVHKINPVVCSRLWLFWTHLCRGGKS